MFDTPVINLLILLSFTYFIGSLILSSVNEMIAAIGGLRARQLKAAIENLLFDPSKTENSDQETNNGTPPNNGAKDPNSATWKAFAQNQLMKSPFIQSLQKTDTKDPSYIPARTFVMAIIGLIGAENYSSANLMNAIKKNTDFPKQFQDILLNFSAKAQNDLSKFENSLENFYNDAMDRVAGWYKRKIRTILLFLGLGLAIALNLDTIKISKDALKDPDKLGKTADRITAELKNINVKNGIVTITDENKKVLVQTSIDIDTSFKALPAEAAKAEDSLKNLNISKAVQKKDTNKPSMKNDTGKVEGKKPADNFKGLKVTYTQTTGYQLGYSDVCDFEKQWGFGNGDWGLNDGNFWLKLLGIFITVAALQFGANYWFDTLNKLINLRGTGKKPKEKKN